MILLQCYPGKLNLAKLKSGAQNWVSFLAFRNCASFVLGRLLWIETDVNAKKLNKVAAGIESRNLNLNTQTSKPDDL